MRGSANDFDFENESPHISYIMTASIFRRFIVHSGQIPARA